MTLTVKSVQVELHRAQTGLTQCYKLAKLWPCLGQLQATPYICVVQWWPPAQGMP
jgi:hypothetical protein